MFFSEKISDIVLRRKWFCLCTMLLCLIACSGKDGNPGNNGTNGLDGAACVGREITAGMEIVCGDIVVDTLKNGRNGIMCELNDLNGTLSLSCGADTVYWVGSVCGLTTYDPLSHFCDSRDQQIYRYVSIGSQVWMAENLAWLPVVHGFSEELSSTPNYYVYADSSSDTSSAKTSIYYTAYGVLYDWVAALTACPKGWHLPSDNEWATLTNFVGGDSVAGRQLKSERGWTVAENIVNDNVFGFSALPGSIHLSSGLTHAVGDYGDWWSATESDSVNAYYRSMFYTNNRVNRRSDNKEDGASVRCIQDEWGS